MCDVHVIDTKTKSNKIIKDVLLVGNSEKLIGSHPYFYRKICEGMDYTPNKLKKAIDQKLIKIIKIDFKHLISHTMNNAGWNTTNTQ
ncbi:hypothetical protein OAA64_01895 [bacterium]|nr:hypothetical protein [bacterium]